MTQETGDYQRNIKKRMKGLIFHKFYLPCSLSCNLHPFFRLCESLIDHFYRWGNMPINEAETFGHEQVVEYLRNYAEARTNDATSPVTGGSSDTESVTSTKTPETPLP